MLHSTRRWRLIVRFGSSLLLASTTLAAIALGHTRESYFSSDDLYLPTLFEDLFHWSGHLEDWSLTPAPYFVPDMLIYFVVRPLFGAVEWAQYVSAFVHLGMYAWAARRLLRVVAPPKSAACELAGLVVLGWLGLYLSDALPLFDALVHPTNHGGGAWLSLIVLGACLAVPRAGLRGHAGTLGLCSLSLSAGYSDPVFAASCGLPLCGLALAGWSPWSWRTQRAQADGTARRELALRSGLAGACALGGAQLLRVFQPTTLASIGDRSVDASWQTLQRMAADLSGPARYAGMWLGGSALLALMVLLRRRSFPRRVTLFALWQLASVLCALSVCAWTGLYNGIGELRYVIVPFCSAPVFVCALALVWLAGRPSMLRLRVEGALAAITLVVVCALLPTQLMSIARGEYASRWRALAACVGELARSEQSDTVLAEYWQAKPLMLFASGRIKVLQMHRTLKSPYVWINSVAWYGGPHRVATVVTKDLVTPAIERRFGAPALRTQCGDLEVFVFRGQGREKLENGMRSRFAATHRR